jgi:hypothetical protein
MSMAIHTDNALGITTYYDPEAPAPTRFFIWFEMRKDVITAKAGETPAATWQRVLAEVQRLRKHFMDGLQRDSEWKRQGYFRGNPFQHAHVFAGIDMPEELGKQLKKRWIIWWCYQMASPTRNPDHEARVEALALICRLEGLYPPQRKQVHIAVRKRAA